ncbi:MAG TPA: hypothetical protein VLV83_02455, partial [Acidobacteriota bacterium]|nr:hypothetical protein [Acidobacteriota bacterium]
MITLPTLSLFLSLAVVPAVVTAQEAEVRSFEISKKVRYLRVRHNEGLLRVRSWDKSDEVEVRFLPRLPEGVESDQVKFFAWKSGGSVYVHSYLYA